MTMTTLQDLIQRDGIRATVGPGESPEWAPRRFTVTLTRPDGGRLVTPFGQGAAHTEEPTAMQVLDSLLSDAHSVLNARDFDEWAGEYSYPMETPGERRDARRAWNAVTRQTGLLAAFLDGALDEYMGADRD